MVILRLNEAIYSVVVPPGQGIIRVEEGRVSVTGGIKAEKVALPSMTGYESKTGNSEFPRLGCLQMFL